MSRNKKSSSSADTDRYVQTGDFAIVAQEWQDARGFVLPSGLFVRALVVEPGTPPKRQCVVAWVDMEQLAIGRVKVPEHILRVVEMQPGKCEPHIDEAHRQLLAAVKN